MMVCCGDYAGFDIGLVKMRSSKTGVFVKAIFKGSHLKNFKFILIGNMHVVG